MPRSAVGFQLLVLFPLCVSALTAQETHTVRVAAPFRWPRTELEAAAANKIPGGEVGSFLEALTSAFTTPASRIGGESPKLIQFRFVPLEARTFYLVATTAVRVGSYTNVVAQVPGGFRYTRIDSETPLPLAMLTVDLDGDGVDELVTAQWPAGYLGANTPPIYWYTVWRFNEGVPQDASAQFPEFYKSFVLGCTAYIDRLLAQLQTVNPEGANVALAESEFVRLKYQREILGRKDAGLEQAITWAESKETPLRIMGIWALAEMSAPAAGETLRKIAGSPSFADLAKAAIARRAKLLGSQP
jgi:hypothetical protein